MALLDFFLTTQLLVGSCMDYFIACAFNVVADFKVL